MIKKVQCQNCKAVLEINSSTGDATCRYCGTKIIIKDIVTNNVSNNYITETFIRKKKPKKEKKQQQVRIGDILFSIAAILLSIFQVKAIYTPDIYTRWFAVHPPLGFLIPFVIMCVFFRVMFFSCSSFCSACMVTLTEITYWGIVNYWGGTFENFSAVIIGAGISIVFSCLAFWLADDDGPLGFAVLVCSTILWIQLFIESGNALRFELKWKLLPILVVSAINFFIQKFGDEY